MTYLIDTDWVIDYLKGRRPAVELLLQLVPDGAAISIITYGETFEGIYSGNDAERHEAVFEHLLSATDVVGLNLGTMKLFARLRGDLRRRGMLIGDPDLLIAATALHHGLTLVTRNVRHFARIEGLRLL